MFYLDLMNAGRSLDSIFSELQNEILFLLGTRAAASGLHSYRMRLLLGTAAGDGLI